MSRSLRPLPIVALGLGLGLVLVATLIFKVAPDQRALAETLARRVKAEIGYDLTIAGDIGLVVLPRPSLVIKGVSLAGAPGIGDAPLIGIARAEVGVRPWALLRGRIEPTRVNLSGVRIALVRGPDGLGNWAVTPKPWGDLPGPWLTDASPGAIPPGVPPEHDDASPFRLSVGAADAGAVDQPALKRHPIENLEIRDAILTWEDRGRGQSLALRGLYLALSRRASGDSFELKLVAGLGLAGAGPDARISAAAGVDLGEGRALVVSDIRAEVTALPATEDFAGPVALTGSLRVQADAAIRFDLAMSELDLDACQSSRGSRATPAEIAPGPVPASPEELSGQPRLAGAGAAAPLPKVRAPAFSNALPLGLDVDGRLSIPRLRIAGLDLRAVEIKATAKGGNLQLDHRVEDFYGGSLAGTLRLELRGIESNINLETAASGFQMGSLLADLAGARGLAGRGDLGVTLVAVGLDRAALIRSLKGRLVLRLSDGALVGVDLGALIGGARLSVDGQPADKLALGGVPRTLFDDLTATVAVADGVLRSDDLVAHSPWFQATGGGTLDLADGRLAGRLIPLLVKPPQGRGLKELEGVPIPVLVSGTLAAPVWRVDVASALREAAGRRLDAQGEGLMEGLEGRTGVKGLGGMLRGLLGR